MTWPNETDGREEIIDFYGEPGTNLAPMEVPFPLRLSWSPDKTIKSFYCHEKVKDSLLRIYKNILLHYGLSRIDELGLNQYGGCYNLRNKRGANVLSLHSWGIAVDFDPMNNALKWNHNKARLAHPVYEYFWHFVASEGWTSLGKEKDKDWMHIQAAKVQ